MALDGAVHSSDLADLLYMEFGKGFEYRTQFTIGMRDLGSQLSKHLVSYAEMESEFKFRLNVDAYESKLILFICE